MSTPTNERQGSASDLVSYGILLPLLLICLGVTIYLAMHAVPGTLALTLVVAVLCVAVSILNVKTRVYSLAVQDRVIRLEERLRLAALVPDAEMPLLHSLTVRQLIALRFASDAELPILAARAAREQLEPKQIKELIVNWRADLLRI